MKYSLNFYSLGKLVVLLALLVAFYYPIAAFFISQLSLPSTLVNVGIRLLLALAFTFLILIRLPTLNLGFKLPFYLWFVLVFWIVYATRIAYDLYSGITFAIYSNFHVIGFAFGNILIPVLTMILYKKFLSMKSVATFLYGILFIANIMILYCFIVQNKGFSVELLLARPHIYATNSWTYGVTPHILNPIQIGYYGSLLTLTSTYFAWFVKKGKPFFVLGGVILGFAMLVLGASRGPFVSFIMSFLIMIFYKLKVSKSQMVQIVKLVLISLFLFFTVKNTIGKDVTLEDLSMFNRMSEFVEDRQESREEARDVVFRNAWNDFLDSPLIGKSFVTSIGGYYPHNIIIELFMALGMTGVFLFFGFFLPMLYFLARVTLDAMGPSMFFLGIFLIPILMGNMFSGSLFQSIDLWMMIVLFLCGYGNFNSKANNAAMAT